MRTAGRQSVCARSAPLVLALILLAGCATPRDSDRDPPAVGQQAPSFTLPKARGGEFSLDAACARGPVVLVFYRGLF